MTPFRRDAIFSLTPNLDKSGEPAMTIPELIPPKFISLKNHPTLNEKWLQDRLAENPSLLGLGDLQMRDSERRQPGAGRLDLLLYDPDSNTRYEVEIQLGATDESHLVRTIEYWDIERRRYTQYDHVAVIVAEDITSRFLNVISLFNGHIPLIAIQMKGVEVGGNFTLVATRVLDRITLGTIEEEAGESVGRQYWESRASANSLKIVDRLLEMIQQVVPGVGIKYNKGHIGLAMPGQSARNFVAFDPQKAKLVAAFKAPQSEELTTKISDGGLVINRYDNRFGYYRVEVSQADLDDGERSELLKELIAMARDNYFSQ